jgi:hypothetical protein
MFSYAMQHVAASDLYAREPPYYPTQVEAWYMNTPLYGRARMFGLESTTASLETRMSMKQLHEQVRPKLGTTMAMHPSFHGTEYTPVDPRDLVPSLSERRHLWLNTEYGARVLHM